MRKTKRFTQSIIELYRSRNRGIGIHSKYSPWHQATRSDPTSQGKSAIYIWNGRYCHFLSTGEIITFLFATQLPNIYDIREQYPLSLDSSQHEINDYTNESGPTYPGTISVSSELNLKHPKIADGSQAMWVMTTDFLVTLKVGNSLELVAISYKPEYPKSKRAIELLTIEKLYWEKRGVKWLLITADTYDHDHATVMRAYYAFVLDKHYSQDLIVQILVKITESKISYSSLVKYLLSQGHDRDLVIQSFWNGFWNGQIPLRIKHKFDPLEPIKLISQEEFLNKNPILAGRSSWI